VRYSTDEGMLMDVLCCLVSRRTEEAEERCFVGRTCACACRMLLDGGMEFEVGLQQNI